MSQSQDAFVALKQFFKLFPEYLDNPLYVSGESYGGIYVPYLAWQIHQSIQKKVVHPNSSEPTINFKGFLVGNGATNWDVDISPSYPPVVYNFNLIPKDLLDTFEQNDCHYYFNDLKTYNNSLLCNNTWDEINNLTTNILNWYDLFRKVYPDDGLLKSGSPNRLKSVNINGVEKTYKVGMTFNEYTPWASYIPKSENHPLLGAYVSDYLNRQDVRRALHIPDTIQAWSQCNNDFQNYYHY